MLNEGKLHTVDPMFVKFQKHQVTCKSLDKSFTISSESFFSCMKSKAKQRTFNTSQLVRNNSDNIKLSLKMFLQRVKWHCYSINYEGLCCHYKIIYAQIFMSSVIIFYIIFEIFYYLFIFNYSI